MAEIKLGVITDHHDDTTTPAPSQPFGDSPGYRIPGKAYSDVSIPKWIATCNDNSVDLAINGGDIVNGPVNLGVGGEDAARILNFQQYVARMGTLNADLLHAFGHWDVGSDGTGSATGTDFDNLVDNTNGIGSLQPAGIANPWWPLSATDLTPIAYTFEDSGFRIVVLASLLSEVGGSTDGQYIAAGPTKTQQEWIDEVALDTALPIIVITHQPLRGSSGASGAGGLSSMEGRDAVIASLEGLAIKPVVLQGHVHKNERFFTDNGITYVNLIGDVWGEESTDTDRFSHSVITITNNNQVYSDVDVRGFGSQSSNSFDASLVAQWGLNEPTGTSAADSIMDSVAASNGTPSKAIVSVNGPIEQKAVNFDASLIVTGDDALILAYPFTFTAWFKRDGTVGADTEPIFSIGDFLVSNKSVNIALFETKAAIWTRNTKSGTLEKSTKDVTDNIWHHIAGVWVGDTERKLYVDGILEEAFSTSATIPSSLVDWTIGWETEADPLIAKFDGDIDDVRVYSVALTASDIEQIWNEGAALGNRGRFNTVSPGRPHDRTRGRY